MIEQALTHSDQQSMRRAVETALAAGLYPRPWPRSIMFAPPQMRTVTLFTVGLNRRGRLRTAAGPENWQRFASVEAERAAAFVGGGDWRPCRDAEDLDSRVDAFEELLRDATFPGARQRSSWNGRDFYVILGGHSWEDCTRYGFVVASGGEVYTRPLEQLAPGKRVFAYYSQPSRGYVGIGTVLASAVPVSEFTVAIDGEDLPVLDAPLNGAAALTANDPNDRERCAQLVRVRWDAAVPIDQAVWETGLFANQMTVCRLRDQTTIELVEGALLGSPNRDPQVASTST